MRHLTLSGPCLNIDCAFTAAIVEHVEDYHSGSALSAFLNDHTILMFRLGDYAAELVRRPHS